MKPFDEPDHPDQENDNRKNISNVDSHNVRKMESDSGIRLRQEVSVSPAAFPGTEECNHQSPERQEIIADNEILQIQNTGSFPQRLEALPQIESKNAGKRTEEQKK